MEYFERIQTITALFGLGMVMLGISFLKSHLKRMLG